MNRSATNTTMIVAAAGAIAFAPAAASAAIVPLTDQSLILSSPGSVVIDFDTDGDGNDVNIPENTSTPMASTEYASQGVTFDRSINWTYDGSPLFQFAQFSAGAATDPFGNGDGNIAIPGGTMTFEISFDTPVEAFSFLVITSRTAAGDAPLFELFGDGGEALGSVSFDQGGNFVDSSSLGQAVEWGFVGARATDGDEIASIRVTTANSILDEFAFVETVIPSPGVTSLLAVGFAGSLGRRRR